MRQGFDRGVIVGIVLLAAMTVGIAATSYVNTRALRAGSERAAHSLEILDAIGTVRSGTRKLQAEQRAYLITGFPDWVKPFEESATALRSAAADLTALTAEDSDQHPRALIAEREIETGVAHLTEVVRLRGQPGGHEAVVTLSRERGRRSFVDPLLETLAEMERAERGRQVVLDAAADEAYTRSVLYGAGAAVLGLVAIGMFVALLRRSVRARSRAAARLDDQRVLLDATLFSIGDAVIATDAAGHVTFLNPVAEALTGWPRDDARGVPIERVFHIVNESTRVSVENPALRAIREGKIVGLANHTVLIARNGVERPIEDSAAPISARGAVSGAVLVFRDVTERKRAEAGQERLLREVEAERERLADVFRHAPSFMAVLRGPEHVFERANDRYSELVSGRELIGKSVRSALPEIEGQGFFELLDRVYRTGESHAATGARVRLRSGADGALEERVLEFVYQPLRDATGSPSGVLVQGIDLTERARAETSLARVTAESELQRRMYETALSNTADFIYLFDTNGRFTYVNKALLDLWGKDLTQAVGKTFFELDYPPDLAARLQRQIREVVETRRPVRDETPYTSAAGTRTYEYIFGPVVGADGGVEAVAGSTRDITERQEAAEALRDAQARLETTLAAGEVATWTWDIGADRVIADRNLARLFGVSEADARGGPIARYVSAVHPDDRPAVEALIRRAVETGEPYEATYRVRGPDEEYRTIVARGKAEYGPDGAPLRLPGVVLDITRQEAARRALAESEERLHLAVAAAKLGQWTLDVQTWEMTCSNECRANYGRGPGEAFSYADLWRAVHHGDIDRVREDVRRAIETRTDYDTEYRTVWPDGTLHWVLVRGRTAYDATGAPREMTGVTLDITDRKWAEERERRIAIEAVAAAEANAKFRTFFEQGSNFAGVMKLDGTVVEANRLCLDACGFVRDDVIGKTFWECGWWNRSPEVTAAVRRGSEEAAAGRLVRLETPYFLADGSERVVDLVLAPVTDAAGRVLFVAATGTDVTDRTREEEAIRFLADASASLAELVDYESTLGRIANLAVGGFADWCVVDVVDAAGERRRLAVANPASVGDHAARGADAAFRPERDAIAGVPHVLRTGEAVVVSDLSEVDPAAPQGERVAQLRALGIRSYLCVPLLSRGRVIGGMTFLSASSRRRYAPAELRVARDLAARVTTAIENATLYRTLQEQDRRKDEFLATLAHELRNPLAPIRNGVQILRTALPPDTRLDRTLEMMERQLGHMVHLIDDLMDVARVSSGKVLLRKERVDLRGAAGSAVETSRQVIDAGRHELEVRLPDEPLVLNADRTRLTQVLANLLNNAAKYTPPGGRIVLSAARFGTEAVIRVTDTGIGIPAEMLHTVFDMFTQVGTSLDRAQGGVGIGLTLVKRLVEMHGGSVTAHSAGTGKGSEFVVRFPLAPGEMGTSAPAPAADVRSDPETRLTILVVDDNRDAADTLCDLLGLKGHEVRTANDGPEALRVLEAFRPNLILLDLGLPGMNGFEVARRVRESPDLRGVAIAALTGWGQDEDRRRTREGGFDHHLVKPVDLEELGNLLIALRNDSR